MKRINSHKALKESMRFIDEILESHAPITDDMFEGGEL